MANGIILNNEKKYSGYYSIPLMKYVENNNTTYKNTGLYTFPHSEKVKYINIKGLHNQLFFQVSWDKTFSLDYNRNIIFTHNTGDGNKNITVKLDDSYPYIQISVKEEPGVAEDSVSFDLSNIAEYEVVNK